MQVVDQTSRLKSVRNPYSTSTDRMYLAKKYDVLRRVHNSIVVEIGSTMMQACLTDDSGDQQRRKEG